MTSGGVRDERVVPGQRRAGRDGMPLCDAGASLDVDEEERQVLGS